MDRFEKRDFETRQRAMADREEALVEALTKTSVCLKAAISLLESSPELLAVRVSAEHYRWLCSARSTISAITHTAGGEVEGRPTSVINILQRIRELVRIEQEMKSPNEDPSGQRREATEIGWMGDIGGNPYGPFDR